VPRPNQPRDVYAENNLRRRVGIEREARGWTYEGLAKRMTDAGCAINASALYKIEKADPPRRITVDELVALSRVLDLTAEDLLAPPELAESKAALVAVQRWLTASHECVKSEEAESQALGQMRDSLNGHPAALKAVEGWIAENIADPSSPKGKEFLKRVTGVDPEANTILRDQIKAARRAKRKA